MAIKSNKDNAQWISPLEVQGSEEGQWIDSQTDVDYIPEEIAIEDDSTSTELVTFTVVAENDSVILVNADNSYDEVELGSVTTTDEDSLVSSTDPFEDGSLFAKYEFDDNNNDTLGNNNMLEGGSYSSGKYNNGLNITDGTSIEVPASFDSTAPYTVSYVLKTTETESKELFRLAGVQFMGINYTEGKASMRIYDGDDYFIAESNITINDGELHVIVGGYDGDNVFISVDNETLITTAFSGTPSTSGDNFGYREAYTGILVDQTEIYTKALTAEEIDMINNQLAIKYTATIDQAEAPTKAFFNTNLQLRTSIAGENKSVVEPLTNLPIDATSDVDKLVTNVEVQDGDKLIVNGSDLVASGVTFDDPLYTIPTEILPTKAYKVNNKELTIDDTPTTTTATVIDVRSGLISDGDMVLLDGVDTVCDVVETFLDPDTQYDLTFEETTEPSEIELADTSSTLTEATDTFDGTKFTKSYAKVDKQGRELQWSAVADEDVEIQKVTVNLNKVG